MWWRRGGRAVVAAGALFLAACGTGTPSGALLPPNTPVASATLEIPQSSVGVVQVASPTGSASAPSGATLTATGAAPAVGSATPAAGAAATNTSTATASGTPTGSTPTPSRTPGPGTPSATLPPTATPTATATPTKTPLPSDDKGFAPSEAPPSTTVIVLVSLTTPIKKGADATLIIQTAPKAQCFLTYVEPNGVVSTAEGLGKKIADGTGFCRWDWKISAATAAGTGRLSVAARGPAVSFDIVITP